MSSSGSPYSNVPMLLLHAPAGGVRANIPQQPTAAPWTPAAPRFGAPNQAASEMLRSLASNAVPKAQPQQQSTQPNLSSLAALGKTLGQYAGLDPTYTGTNQPFMESLFGNAAGYGGLFGMTPNTISQTLTPTPFDPSSLSMPTFNF